MDYNILSKEFDGRWGNDIKTVIVGTMPGQESIDGGFYYLSNRNSFWKIMDGVNLNGFSFTEAVQNKDYNAVIQALKNEGIALYDVLSACDRGGTSSDKKIKNPTRNENLAELLKTNPEIKVIFNGRTAQKLFKKLFKKLIGNRGNYIVVGSSSNANSKRVADKIQEWGKAIH